MLLRHALCDAKATARHVWAACQSMLVNHGVQADRAYEEVNAAGCFYRLPVHVVIVPDVEEVSSGGH